MKGSLLDPGKFAVGLTRARTCLHVVMEFFEGAVECDHWSKFIQHTWGYQTKMELPTDWHQVDNMFAASCDISSDDDIREATVGQQQLVEFFRDTLPNLDLTLPDKQKRQRDAPNFEPSEGTDLGELWWRPFALLNTDVILKSNGSRQSCWHDTAILVRHRWKVKYLIPDAVTARLDLSQEELWMLWQPFTLLLFFPTQPSLYPPVFYLCCPLAAAASCGVHVRSSQDPPALVAVPFIWWHDQTDEEYQNVPHACMTCFSQGPLLDLLHKKQITVEIKFHKADAVSIGDIWFYSQRCHSWRPESCIMDQSGVPLATAYWGMGVDKQHPWVQGLVVTLANPELAKLFRVFLDQGFDLKQRFVTSEDIAPMVNPE